LGRAIPLLGGQGGGPAPPPLPGAAWAWKVALWYQYQTRGWEGRRGTKGPIHGGGRFNPDPERQNIRFSFCPAPAKPARGRHKKNKKKKKKKIEAVNGPLGPLVAGPSVGDSQRR